MVFADKKDWAEDVEKQLDEHHDRLNSHTAAIEEIKKAFPGGDLDGHCRAHEAFIERTAELRRLRIAIQEKTISGLLWVAIIWLGLAAFHEVQSLVLNYTIRTEK